MHAKRSILAYGVAEQPEGIRQPDESRGGSDPDNTSPAAHVLLRQNVGKSFDAEPVPEVENADARIRAAREAMPDASSLRRLAERLKALADPSRLTMLNALATSEMRVGELAEAVLMSQSAVSHQLRVLRAAQLVAVRREGKNAWYRLADPCLIRLIAPEQQ